MTAPPLNTLGGMRLRPRGPGYQPGQTQRAIGGHVYIFQPQRLGLAVWRLDLADGERGYRWTVVHECWRWVAAPAPAEHLALPVLGEDDR